MIWNINITFLQVFRGYYKNPEQSANSFSDGWFKTGDIGHYDSYGIVYIVDRIKELIKYKGFQVKSLTYYIYKENL